MWAARASLTIPSIYRYKRIRVTGSVKIWKVAAKYPWIYGHFFECVSSPETATSSVFHVRSNCQHMADEALVYLAGFWFIRLEQPTGLPRKPCTLSSAAVFTRHHKTSGLHDINLHGDGMARWRVSGCLCSTNFH